jgi:flagellar biosynthetic protein FliO
MKFIRNSRTRERVVDVLTKGALIALSALVCLWMVSGARAAGATGITAIKQEQLADGTWAVDFLLAKPVAKEDVSVDFQRNFIQLSLKGVTAYPARTEKLKHPDLEKVFTYQYQPDLARARVLVKGQASSIKNRSQWEVTERGIRITVGANPNAIATTEDAVKAVAAAPSKSSGKETIASADAEEAARAEILGESSAPAKNEAVKADSHAAAKNAKPADPESLPLFANSGTAAPAAEKSRELPVSKMLGSLFLVVVMIGAVAMGFRKFALGKGSPFVRQPKMIEVISSQSMGPKRSIAVVKVLDQYMVVGMSGDGMNLLTNLGADVKIDRFIDAAGPGGSFTDVFHGAMSTDAAPPTATATQAAAPKGDPGVRNSIKKRLEGFKPLRGN